MKDKHKYKHSEDLISFNSDQRPLAKLQPFGTRMHHSFEKFMRRTLNGGLSQNTLHLKYEPGSTQSSISEKHKYIY